MPSRAPPGRAVEFADGLEVQPDRTPYGAVPPEDSPFASLVREMLAQLGEDPARQGLLRTPDRVKRSMRWLTRG